MLSAPEVAELCAKLDRKECTPVDAPNKIASACSLPVAATPALQRVLDTFSQVWGFDFQTETVSAVRYEPGSGGFHPHVDRFDMTGVVYLTEVTQDAGSLKFPRANLTIVPQVGSMLTWANLIDGPDGSRQQDWSAEHLVLGGGDHVRYTLQLQGNYTRARHPSTGPFVTCDDDHRIPPGSFISKFLNKSPLTCDIYWDPENEPSRPIIHMVQPNQTSNANTFAGHWFSWREHGKPERVLQRVLISEPTTNVLRSGQGAVDF